MSLFTFGIVDSVFLLLLDFDFLGWLGHNLAFQLCLLLFKRQLVTRSLVSIPIFVLVVTISVLSQGFIILILLILVIISAQQNNTCFRNTV